VWEEEPALELAQISSAADLTPTRSRNNGRREQVPSELAKIYSPKKFLRLKRFANQFVRLHRDGFVGDALVYHARHQNDGNARKFRALFDLAANRISILVRHN